MSKRKKSGRSGIAREIAQQYIERHRIMREGAKEAEYFERRARRYPPPPGSLYWEGYHDAIRDMEYVGEDELTHFVRDIDSAARTLYTEAKSKLGAAEEKLRLAEKELQKLRRSNP